MAAIRIAVTLGCLLLAGSALATNLTDIIDADQNLKNGLLNKNSPSPSPTPSPPATPFIPAPVSVQVSATQAPSPTKPPQTNPPTTPVQSTTVAPSTTPLPTSCTGLAANAPCAASQAGVTRPSAIVGGRCVNGACVGTQITLCVNNAKPTACVVGTNKGGAAAYCDALTPADAAFLGVASTSTVAVTGTQATACNSSSDCPLGQL
ncbi:g13537 [Coccomyxa viridis]|uniref:G13537 protein n=1 Tax=Coccomyxa viridis TaxID=1274662 RepID=A0ABP1GFM0_9CHLO